MSFFNTIGTNLRSMITPNQASRYELHGEGIKGVSEDALSSFRESVSDMVDYVEEKTPAGTSKAMGAAGTILAVGAGLALSEVILVGAASYYIGKKLGEVGSRTFRQSANEALNTSEYNN